MSFITFESGFSSTNLQAYYIPATRKVEINGRIYGTFPASTVTYFATLNSTYKPITDRWYGTCSALFKGVLGITTSDGKISATTDFATSTIIALNIEYYI